MILVFSINQGVFISGDVGNRTNSDLLRQRSVPIELEDLKLGIQEFTLQFYSEPYISEWLIALQSFSVLRA